MVGEGRPLLLTFWAKLTLL